MTSQETILVNLRNKYYDTVKSKFTPVGDETESSSDESLALYRLYVEKNKKLESDLKSIRNRVFTEIREYQAKDFVVQRNKFYRSWIRFAFLVSAVVIFIMALSMKDLLSWTTAMFFSVLICLLYFLILFFQIKKNSTRHRYNWGRFYWTVKDGKTAGASCSA